MFARGLVVAAGLATALVSVGCASGDGVPKALVRNSLSGCIVEAAWYDDAEDKPWGRAYGWSDAIGTNGQTSTREVVEGKGYAYAVVVEGASDCYAAARNPGGKLYKTNEVQVMEAGKTTSILFSDQTAAEATNETICRFCRLGCCTNSVPVDAGTD